jgi:glutaredoxin-related protein
MELLNDEPSELLIIKDAHVTTITALKETHKHYTYPFIFLDNKFLGGYDKLREHFFRVSTLLTDVHGKQYDDF